jgi:hypothetical protein
MEQRNLNIEDNSGDKKYFTIVPNFILNHSTAVDQAVYLQLKRLTDESNKMICYPSFRYLTKQLGIGVNSLRKSIKYLIEHRWIEDRGKQRIRTAGGYQFVQTYKVNDIWKLNMDYFQGVSNKEHLKNKGVSKTTLRCVQNEAKVYPVIGAKEEHKNNIKKNISSFKKIDSFLEGKIKERPYYQGQRVVESPRGSKKLCIWENGDCLEFAGKSDELEWR